MEKINDIIAEIKDELEKMEVDVDSKDARASLRYVREALIEESRKSADKRVVGKNGARTLAGMIAKWLNLSLPLDGVNVVISGANMTMVTYQGYKNKVLKLHPNATFDVQVVREDDDFTVEKQSGKVIYSHKIKPFSNSKIVGAYCVIKTGDAEHYEGLSAEDFEKMKKSSRNNYLWEKWDTEFWLKSVIKRACKRYFFEEVKDIDTVDNSDYGLTEEPQEDAFERLKKAETIAELKAAYASLAPAEQAYAATIARERLRKIKEETAVKVEG